MNSDDFDSLSTYSKVWEKANEIRSIILEISSDFRANVSFQLGAVYEQKEDGSRHGTVFRSGQPGLLEISAEGGTWTVNPPISAEEKLRLEAERLEHEYQEKLALVSSRLLPALQDKRALEVYRLLQQYLNGDRMYKIYEIIEADLEGKLNNLASKNAWKRFRGSVNHPEILGNDSRHSIPQGEPPSNPMSLGEAQVFISNVADLWFKQKSIYDSNQ